VNTDLERRSAQIKFKQIEEAEAAASAYFNKPRDEHILGVPQIRIKYVQNPTTGGRDESNMHQDSP